MKQLKTKGQIKEYYESECIARDYEKSRFIDGVGHLIHENQVRIIKYYVSKVKGDKIMEIAPGPARITSEIKVRSGIAIENSPEMLKIANNKRLKNWRFKKGDAFNLDLRKQFNLIYTLRFVRHFKLEDRKKIYKQVYDHLISEGYFIFEAPNQIIEIPWRKLVGIHKYPIYDKFWSKKELIKEMEYSGFGVVTLKNSINLFFLQEPISKILLFLKFKIGIVKFLEKINIGIPLEWIVICKKR